MYCIGCSPNKRMFETDCKWIYMCYRYALNKIQVLQRAITPKCCKKIITVRIHYTFQYQDLAANEVSSWYLLVFMLCARQKFL